MRAELFVLHVSFRRFICSRSPTLSLVTQPPELPRSRRAGRHETGPVFADPSGQRRRLLRVFGAAASALLVGALIVAGIGLFGGPDTPFSVFSAHGHGDQGGSDPGKKSDQGGYPGTSAPGAGSTSHGASRSRSSTPSPTASPSSSPSPTNGAGKTPPGRSRSRRPHPSPSPHSP